MKSKKIMALMMAVLMILSLAPAATVFAETSCEVEIGTVTAEPGSTVIVPISITKMPYELGAAMIWIDYDHTKLELTAIDPINKTEGGIITMDSDLVTALEDSIQAPGVVQLFWFDNVYGGTADNHIKTTGLFANLVFTVSADAEGTLPLALNPETYFTKYDYMEDTWDVSAVNDGGAVVVESAETPTPVPPTSNTITISVDDTKGMVLNMATGLAVKNGQAVTVDNGAAAQFKVVAYGGYKIGEVVYNGGAPAGSGMFKYVVNTDAVTSDTTLAVTFDDYAPGTPLVDSYDEVFVSTEAEEPIAVSYGTVHGNSAGTSAGIIIWDTGAADVTLEEALADPDDGIYVFSATTGAAAQGISPIGQFGIKIKSLDSGSYKMKTYVVKDGNVDYGDIVTFAIA